jgi:hypothetical protein
MFGPDYTAGCPACSAIADGFNGFAVLLANHDVMLWSRAPLAKLQASKRRMGWTFPWASSLDSCLTPPRDRRLAAAWHGITASSVTMKIGFSLKVEPAPRKLRLFVMFSIL